MERTDLRVQFFADTRLDRALAWLTDERRRGEAEALIAMAQVGHLIDRGGGG